MKHLIVVVAASILFAAALPAKAAPLGLTLPNQPDVFSSFLTVSYNAGSDDFLATGSALSFDDDGVGSAANITGGTFDITATIDNTGTPTAGSLTITGSVLGFGPTLLTADLTNFGFLDSPGGDIFEFLFTVTGGDLAIPQFYGTPGPSSIAGVILDAAGSSFGGTFDTNFDNGFFGFGVSDTKILPEPATLFLVLIAGAFIRRKR